jgi:NAD(P)-dependent dehydrogenase (short-subunit alcohol dehydrogenase family)
MLMGLAGLTPLLDIDPDLGGIFQNTMPVTTVEARDVSEAVLYLASDESRYVTGLELTVDAGQTIR